MWTAVKASGEQEEDNDDVEAVDRVFLLLLDIGIVVEAVSSAVFFAPRFVVAEGDGEGAE